MEAIPHLQMVIRLELVLHFDKPLLQLNCVKLRILVDNVAEGNGES